jgi:hypothetical protein
LGAQVIDAGYRYLGEYIIESMIYDSSSGDTPMGWNFKRMGYLYFSVRELTF